MRKQSFLFIFIVLIINSGCKKNPIGKLFLKEDLQQTLDMHPAHASKNSSVRILDLALWKKHRQKQLSKCYVSSGFPKKYEEDIQSRGASTNKSFTTVDISMLRQQNN